MHFTRNAYLNYLTISEFYEQCLEKHGPIPQGVDWPNHIDLIKRFNVMLDLFAHEHGKNISLLDLGCGYGALVDHLNELNMNASYTGIDISQKMINTAKLLHPQNYFFQQDILTNPLNNETFDYVIMNGLFTEKRSLSWYDMAEFAKQMISQAFKVCKKGIAFNVMSYHVDWCDPALFYWSFNDLAVFLYETCTRHIVFRSDYGLYEYTVYAYKNPIK